jgi:GDP/UDP-N,N'-diacetylbacillosamine 2-epimerase (hydrolysing)
VKTRRIAVITGSRAEFGLLSRVVSGLRDALEIECSVIVTGTHLSAMHGLTVGEIEGDGIPVSWRIPLELSSDSSTSIIKAMGQAMIGFADAFEALRPELIVVLGDRYEILAAASAAALACIPVAHLHGGEISAGAVDDALRHAITKLSHLHFVAAQPYRERVIQMGEQPSRVFVVGGLGVDLALQTPLLDREAFELDTGFRFGKRNLVITFHPVTRDLVHGAAELEALLGALATLSETHLVFTLPNADVGNASIRRRIEGFVASHQSAWAFSSLGFRRYLSLVALSDGVVGNSSSGLIEAPALHVGTVNVGQRQAGRLRATSVIDCAPAQADIVTALERLSSDEFRDGLRHTENPYGDGGAAERVIRVLRTTSLETLASKDFYDLPGGELALTAHD